MKYKFCSIRIYITTVNMK